MLSSSHELYIRFKLYIFTKSSYKCNLISSPGWNVSVTDKTHTGDVSCIVGSDHSSIWTWMGSTIMYKPCITGPEGQEICAAKYDQFLSL